MEACLILCIVTEIEDCRAASKQESGVLNKSSLGFFFFFKLIIFLSYSFDAQGRSWKHRFGDQHCRVPRRVIGLYTIIEGENSLIQREEENHKVDNREI